MNHRPCDLCGLPADAQPHELRARERTWLFCCEACKGIFQMLHGVEELPPPPPPPARRAANPID